MPGDYPYAPQQFFGTVRPAPTGLRKAAVILMWATTASVFFLGFAAFNRKSVWDDFVDGSKGLTDLDDADSFIGTALLLTLVLVLATAIVLAVWSNRVAGNAKARGAAVNPGLAAGGWFIPIAWFVVPFGELRKALGGRGDGSSIGVWQGLFAVATIGGAVALQLFDADDSGQSPDDVSSGLRNQSVGLFIAAVVFIGATVFAMRALRSIEDATFGV